MLSSLFIRAFSKSSERTERLAIIGRRIRKEHGQIRKPDLLRLELPSQAHATAFDKRPIPKGYRQFIDDVMHLANDEVKKAYNIENGTPREIKFARKMELVRKWGKNEKDFGNPAVQVGAMTENIMFLANHVRKNNTDTLAYLNLRQALEDRRKMLQYLGRYDYHLYEEVCSYLGINRLNYAHHKEVKNLIIQNT